MQNPKMELHRKLQPGTFFKIALLNFVTCFQVKHGKNMSNISCCSHISVLLSTQKVNFDIS